MSFELEASDIKALTQRSSNKLLDLDLLLRKARNAKSIRRRHPFKECCSKSYEDYVVDLDTFIKDNIVAIRNLYCGEIEGMLQAVKAFRTLMVSKTPPIDQMIDLCLLPKFVELLDSPRGELALESAWVLTNMAVGSTVQTRYVLESGAVAGLVRLLWTNSDMARVQAVWALGNLAGLHLSREEVVRQGALAGVVHVLKCSTRDSDLLKCAWALEHLCSGDRDPCKLVQVLPVVHHLLLHPNEEVSIASLKVLYILSFHQELVKEIVNSGILSNLQKFINCDEKLFLSLRIIANVTNSKEDYFKQKVLDTNILHNLIFLIDYNDVTIECQICEIIYNISCGNSRQVQTIADSNLFSMLWRKVLEEINEKSQYYIVSTMLNIASKSGQSQITHILDSGVIIDLSCLMEEKNQLLLQKVLCCLEKCLIFGEKESLKTGKINQVAIEIVKCGGLDLIENLLSHEAEGVYLKAYELIERFYDEDEHSGDLDLQEMYEHSICKSSA